MIGFFGYKPFWRVMPGFVLGVLNTHEKLVSVEDIASHAAAQQGFA